MGSGLDVQQQGLAGLRSFVGERGPAAARSILTHLNAAWTYVRQAVSMYGGGSSSMANHSVETERAAQAAVDEAVRAVADSSRRTAEQAQQASRAFLDRSSELNRSILGAWLGTGEAMWRTTFELQNAQLSAARAWWQMLAESNRWTVELLQRWDGLSRESQQTWLDLFQASARSVASAAEQSVNAAERGARSSR